MTCANLAAHLYLRETFETKFVPIRKYGRSAEQDTSYSSVLPVTADQELDMLSSDSSLNKVPWLVGSWKIHARGAIALRLAWSIEEQEDLGSKPALSKCFFTTQVWCWVLLLSVDKVAAFYTAKPMLIQN